jgi:O-antigen/teichoic acid export membrane protein
MNIKKLLEDSLFKNSIYLIATNFTSLIFGFFFWIIASRYYSPDHIGIVSTILSSMSLISLISSVGLPTALLFYLPRDQKNANKIINSCIIVSIIISVLFSVIFISGINIFEPLLKPTFNNLGITIFIIITAMTTVSALISGAFTAERRSYFTMIKENIFNLVKIFPLIIFTGFGAMGIFISWGIGLIMAVIIGFILLYKLFKYLPRFTFDPIIKNMAGYSVGNYFAGIFQSLPKLVLPIMIADIISIDAAGYFFIAITVAGLLYAISQSIANSLLAESSIKGDIWEKVGRAVRLNLFLLIPGLLSFVIFGKFIMGLFNQSYAENATMTLIILAITSVPFSVISIFNTVRNAQNKVVSTIKINMYLAIMTLILSIPLMIVLNIAGVALAYLIADSIGALFIIIRIKNSTEFTLKLLNVKKYADRPIE